MNDLNINSNLIMRLFKLTTKKDKQTIFHEVGVENLTKSIKNEKGTLSMYAANIKDNKNINYVLEIYKDEDSYKIHAKSDQFQKYVNMATNSLDDREVFEIQQQFIAEKRKPIFEINNIDISIRLAILTIKDGFVDKFKNIVLNEMKIAMKKEDDILAMYAATLKNDINKWYFFEIYKDENAYDEHRKTEHFITYIEGTKNMVISKELFELESGILVNKGILNI